MTLGNHYQTGALLTCVLRLTAALLCLVLFTGSLSASPDGPDFAGDWRAKGFGWQDGVKSSIQCRLHVKSLAEDTHQFEHRCGNASGIESFSFTLTLHANGRADAVATDGSQQGALTGRWTATDVDLSTKDEAGQVVIQLRKMTQNSFAFFIQSIAGTERRTLDVTYLRQ